MTKTLVQHGNSAALILDKPILELLNVSMDTPLEITTDGRRSGDLTNNFAFRG